MKQAAKKYFFVFAAIAVLLVLGYLIFKPGVHNSSSYRNWSRLRIIGQTQSALELYFKDNKQYPKDLSLLVPKYLGTLSNFPVLNIKNSACPLTEPYSYQTAQDMKDYKITFCLPESSSEYQAGYEIAAPNKLATPAGFR